MKQKKITVFAAAAAAVMLTQAVPVSAAGTDTNKSYETTDALCAVASVSKVFAAAAAMQLADEGKLDLDEPVVTYLPDFKMADARYQDITVRMLMNHSSGLMGSCYGNDILYDDRSREPHDGLLKHLSKQRLKAAPGAYSAYCNDGFEVLEQVVEAVSGEDFTEYMEQHICKPLGMQQTGSVWNAFRTPETVRIFGSSHAGQLSASFSVREYPPEYCMTIGEGGVLSTAPELCRFGTAFFTGNTTLLSDKAKKEMTRCYALSQYEDGFGLGWDTVEEEEYSAAGVQVVSKGGDLSHQHAELLVAPDEHISISVLSSGGGSDSAKRMAKALMDVALADKGYTVSRTVPDMPETVERVPEKYLKYEGLYMNADGIWNVTFPDGKYMQMDSVTERIPARKQYMYTDTGKFILMYGKVESGQAAPENNMQQMDFCELQGNVYMTAEDYAENGSLGKEHRASYYMQKIEAEQVSKDAQQAWNARNRKQYYLISDKYSSTVYNERPCQELTVPEEVPGYVNAHRIVDADHAEAALHIPSSQSRDQTDIAIRTENGTEYLDLTALGMTFIEEDAIPDLPADLKEVKLTSGAAAWYNIDSQTCRSITMELPAHAAVYVYDARNKVLSSTLIKGTGNTVSLPKSGKIVFLGETGDVIRIKQ